MVAVVSRVVVSNVVGGIGLAIVMGLVGVAFESLMMLE